MIVASYMPYFLPIAPGRQWVERAWRLSQMRFELVLNAVAVVLGGAGSKSDVSGEKRHLVTFFVRFCRASSWRLLESSDKAADSVKGEHGHHNFRPAERDRITWLGSQCAIDQSDPDQKQCRSR